MIHIQGLSEAQVKEVVDRKIKEVRGIGLSMQPWGHHTQQSPFPP